MPLAPSSAWHIGLMKMSSLRSVLVTDSATVVVRGEDVVLWLGAGPAPATLTDGRRCLVLEPSSARAAAVYASACPATLRLALADPLAFASLLVEVAQAPALRAA